MLIATPPDPTTGNRDRRAFMVRAAVLALAGATSTRATASTPLRVATPPIALGPFYPPEKPADSDADLTRIGSRGDRAAGTPLYVSGRVTDFRGKPLPGAELELWQANAFGRYHHPSDSDASGAFDPAFQGYGRLVVDSEGRFRIKTIKPPPYSGRTPHIHFNVADGPTRLTTQMFFEGEAGNERDGLYRHLSRQDRHAATGRFVDRGPAMEADAIAVVWDIVLRA